MLGQKLRELRQSKGILQRQVAAELGVDTAYVSKIEHGEKPINRNHLKTLSKLFNSQVEELITLWLTDKVLDVVRDEKPKVKVLEIALKKIQNKK